MHLYGRTRACVDSNIYKNVAYTIYRREFSIYKTCYISASTIFNPINNSVLPITFLKKNLITS